MSETSSRGSFPDLRNFRYARVKGFRRVMRHSPHLFVERGIANMDTLEMASLCAEPCDAAKGYEGGFVACAFDVDQPSEEEMAAFRAREEEFDLVEAEFTELSDEGLVGKGLLCAASTDEKYVELWGQDVFDQKYTANGLKTIWGWAPDSGLRPCPVYLRHCVLATEKVGEVRPDVRDSFLDETFLADRTTTIRQYLASEAGTHVMDTRPPPSLVGRYSG